MARKITAAGLSLVTVPAVLGIGFLIGRLSNSGYGNAWFDRLAKPPLMPPGWVFGVAWSILYILLGIALALILTAPRSPARDRGLTLFAAQLLLNFCWSPLFFAFHRVGPALLVIAAILALTLAAAATLAPIRRGAAWLLLPYVGWLLFATYLNFEIWRLNP